MAGEGLRVVIASRTPIVSHRHSHGEVGPVGRLVLKPGPNCPSRRRGWESVRCHDMKWRRDKMPTHVTSHSHEREWQITSKQNKKKPGRIIAVDIVRIA